MISTFADQMSTEPRASRDTDVYRKKIKARAVGVTVEMLSLDYIDFRNNERTKDSKADLMSSCVNHKCVCMARW